MTNPANRPNPRQEQRAIQGQLRNQTDLSADQQMIQTIRSLKDGQLRNYEIRQLVKEAELLGTYLKEQKLKTNQIRKFLDAVKRLKAQLAQEDKKDSFSVIKDELFLLKPKLAYAAVRQQDRRSNPVKPLSDVMSEAIDKVKDSPDFYRLVQLIESIIAYHKAAGGEDN